MAEILSTVVLLQLAVPGCALVACPEPALADMRTGEYVCGAPEANLMSLACIEMCARYGLPSQAPGVGGDGAFPDYQEGAEGAGAAVMAALAGADSLVGCGTLEGAQSFSLAKCVLDSDSVGFLRRMVGGLRVGEGDALIEDIAAVGPGGHFLGRRSTRRLRTSGQIWEPAVFGRGRTAGAAAAPQALVARAAARAAEIVREHAAEPLTEDAARHADAVIAA
jgi:trimethylamine--corrinoid protein Co-methyltransferase